MTKLLTREQIEAVLDDGRLFAHSPDGWWLASRRHRTYEWPTLNDFCIGIRWKKRCKGVVSRLEPHLNAKIAVYENGTITEVKLKRD